MGDALADTARRYADALRSRPSQIRRKIANLPPRDRRRALKIEAGHLLCELQDIEAGGAEAA